MATPVNMPKLGLSMKEGTVGKWLKNEGDIVKQGEALIEIMTDKIANKIDAPVDGILLKIVAAKKVKLPVGGLLAVIGAAGEDIRELLQAALPSASAKAAAPAAKAAGARAAVSVADGAKVKISPAARKLAQDSGFDYSGIAGTGPEGRITREDIESAMAAASVAGDDRPTLEVIPYEGMRQAIGENMANSWAVAPKVTHHVSVDLSALQALRTTINSDVKDTEKISVTDILVKAVAKALEKYPKINATLSGDEIKVLADINIGVAIALVDGLVVPVIKNANKKSLAEVSKDVKDFAKRARKNKLETEEMTGGTFTVTNLGGYGSVDWFTPIINQPESAILGVGRTVKKPVVVGDQIVIRPMMGLSLSFDHRVIDGAPAAEFLSLVIKLIEQPHRIFI
jgi:pyruvate dehydrogenase E2 component (dihydrolipoamide acetyltransferase)